MRHMAGPYVPYASCVVFIQQPYGKAICLPYGIDMDAIWLYHDLHMDAIWTAYCLVISVLNTYGLSGANHIYAHMLAI